MLMSIFENFRWLWLYLLFGLFIFQNVKTAWPPSNASNIQLLGLFSDPSNVNKSTISFSHCRAMFKAAIILSHQYHITIQGQSIDWQSIQSGGDPMVALGNTCQLMSNSSIVGIVGAGLSRESVILASFAAKVGVPLVSYSSTDPSLSDANLYPTFYRTVPSDNTAALVIAQLFIRFNWTSCILIYQNDAYGSGAAKVINERFIEKNLIVTQMIVFDIGTLNIRGDLKSLLMSSSTRIVILWVDIDYISLVLQYALDANVVGPQFTWILTSDVSLDSFNQTSYEKLNGILSVQPVVGNVVNASINETLLNAAYKIWQEYEPETYPGSDNVDYYALFAFDATWLLIKSVEQLCLSYTMNNSSNNSYSCLSFIGDAFCFNRHLVNSNLLMNIIDRIAFVGVSGVIEYGSNGRDRVDGNYYIVKNVQSSSNSVKYVSVLVWLNSSGWTTNAETNVIVWPGNSLKVPTGNASLSGVTLRIAIIEAAPFTMTTQVQNQSGYISIKPIGYVPDLLEELQNRMGFTPDITLLPVNSSYNKIIDTVAQGGFDMFVGDVTITADRRNKVAFSNSIFYNSLRIITRDAVAPSLDFWAYLKPFSRNVWLTVLGATLFAGILVGILEGEENEALRDRPIVSRFVMSIWFSFGQIMGYGVEFRVVTAAGRLITAGLYILCLILVAAYTASLASSLTLSKSAGILSGLDDIKNGKLSFSRIGIITDSSIEAYYLREISGGSRNFYPLTSQGQIYSALLDNTIDAAIMDAGTIEYATNTIYCNLTLVGTSFDQSTFGIVFQKDWLYELDLDVAILSIKESGTLDNLKNKWFEKRICSSLPESSTAMTIESMAGLFVTFGCISVLSILLFVWKNRLIIKHYLFVLVHRESTSSQQTSILTEQSNETVPKDSLNREPSTNYVVFL